MRRRRLGWLLALAIVLVPMVEIYTIIQIGQVIGPWWTIALLVADGFLGAWLIRREGRRAWQALRSALQAGRMPATELADGILILIGGTLMLTPGFVTDLFALLLILPFTRPVGRRVLAGLISRRLMVFPAPSPFGQTQQRPEPTDVVRGEVVEE